MKRLIGLLLSSALLVAACGDDGNGSGGESSACEQAFAAAARVSDMQDTAEDLDPAVRACSSVEEWTAASQRHPDALDGADPLVFLGNRCLYGSGLGSTALCRALSGESPSAPVGFSDSVRSAYLDGCLEDGNEAFCNCTLDEFEKIYSEDDFEELATQLGSPDEAPQEFVEVILACLDQLDG